MANNDDPESGAPDLSLGDFHWDPVSFAQTRGEIPLLLPAPAPLGPLAFLQGKNFAGKGFNTIFRPRSNQPLDGAAVPGQNIDNDLQLNLTVETLSFTKPIGNIPNRGLAAQPDIVLGGITYVQSISDVTNTRTGSGDGKATGIHLEPGVWLSIPATPDIPEGATLCRMASIPHGTTINAQGVQPDINGKPGKPSISPVDITPFVTGSKQPIPFPSQQLANKENRLPTDLDLFNQKGTITQQILNDPNTVLRNAIQHQDIVNTITFKVSTLPPPVIGGGTANIAFLGGQGATVSSAGPSANAFGASMTSSFWIETVRWQFSVPHGQPNPTKISPAGQFGPTFVVPPTIGHPPSTTFTATSTQLQYSQTVMLEFAGLTWPHVSVATLGETTEIPVPLPTS